jgi:riboflavin biosynthesis pyrimidine reductase
MNDGISYLVTDGPKIDLAAMLDVLGRNLGIRRLLLEGGGGINGWFPAAGLVDEISLLIVPPTSMSECEANHTRSDIPSDNAESGARSPMEVFRCHTTFRH